jgi:hypothetical protein
VSASEPIDLAAENALLRTAVASLTEAKDQLQAQVVTLTEKLEVLLARVAQMSRRMYANTTERHNPNQQTIFGDPAWYHYTENRAGVHPQTVLIDYTGFLVADAYAGFDRIFIAVTAIEIACWAHTRRKFFEALNPPDPQRSGQPAPTPPRTRCAPSRSAARTGCSPAAPTAAPLRPSPTP